MPNSAIDLDAPLASSRRPALLYPKLGAFYRWGEPLAFALLRVGLGAVVISHGIPKVFHLAHGSMTDPAGATALIISNKLGLPGGSILAAVIGFLELFGGMLLALGALTRLVAPIFAIEMLFICTAFWPIWPWFDRGMEFPFVLGLMALFVSMRGGGRYSIDRLLGREL